MSLIRYKDMSIKQLNSQEKSQLLPAELREHCRREGGRIVGARDKADLCEWCLLDTMGLCAHEFPAAVGPV